MTCDAVQAPIYRLFVVLKRSSPPLTLTPRYNTFRRSSWNLAINNDHCFGSLTVDNMNSLGTNDVESGMRFDGTVKGSNFIHNGFYDLLAMLPTGSGTGASAFFASTPGNTINKEDNLPSQEYFSPGPINQPDLDDNRSCGEKTGDVATDVKQTIPHTKNANQELHSVNCPIMEAWSELPSSAPGLPALPPRRTPSAAPPAPVLMRPLPTSSLTSAQGQRHRVPVPAVSPSLPAATTARPPLSLPLSSAMAVFASHSPKRESRLVFNRPVSGMANRFSVLFTPVAKPSKAIFDVGPERETRQVGGLWSPERQTMAMAQTSPGNAARAQKKSGKIDKRLISWPMDFR